MMIPQTTREYRLPKVDGFHNLTLVEAPIPKLKSNQVLVKVHAVSLQYRDLIVAKGEFPFMQKKNPVPGSDMAGEIIALGEDVTGWKLGERVSSNFATDHLFGDITEETKATSLGGAIDGVLTEYKVLPAHALVRVPEHLSYEEAATLPCAALTGYSTLTGTNSLKGGDTVLVQGTGGVSIFALQLAVASGALVIVISSSDKKLEVAKKLGAHHVLNYKTVPEWDAEVLKLTKGRGVDHVIEVGGPHTLLKSVNCVRYGGTIHIIGFIAGQYSQEAQVDLSRLPLLILGKAVQMRSNLIGSRTKFEEMNRLISAVKLRPVIDKVFDFENLREAYEYQAQQQHVGKIVIKVSKD
ncbi:NAD(P)-binding protein [Lentinus tigrinus ALCF2SS1-7]|uniref:NAD(P)-binding protein n=1 Tax=Lentinus tigrinus ALCF2SS1-7 TaxID=1328758 RepID=UPI00116633E1|nr:NAD(P)-binding protein [Lentinus tigrinus ALCF2SS1-7]